MLAIVKANDSRDICTAWHAKQHIGQRTTRGRIIRKGVRVDCVFTIKGELPARRGFLRNIELAPANFSAQLDGMSTTHQREHVCNLTFLAGENGWGETGVSHPGKGAWRKQS